MPPTAHHLRDPAARRSWPLLAAAAALALACAKPAGRPEAPVGELHYPAWLATTSALPGQLLAVNLDQDLAFDGGSVVSIDATSVAPVLPVGGLPVPSMAGKLMVVDDKVATAQNCDFPAWIEPPFGLVAGRSDDQLIRFPLQAGQELGATPGESIRVAVDGAARPFGLGLTCGPDRKPRVWTSFQRGIDGKGYVAQVDLSGDAPAVVKVSTGKGAPRSFAYDRDRDRLYFSTRESGEKAPIRWITVGGGCKRFDDGVQDERRGGCHVDPGFDLSPALAGIEPNELALSSGLQPCTASGYEGSSCRRMYVSARVYDVDLARALGERPSKDVGGRLVVLELPESSLGGPDPQWITSFDIGITAGELLVIPRSDRPDLVVALALEDGLLWIYDDEVGAMVKVFGRDTITGVPPLGHMLAGLASQDLGDGRFRLFVSSYHDHWVSAVDVPLADPSGAYVVHEGADPTDESKPILRLGVEQ